MNNLNLSETDFNLSNWLFQVTYNFKFSQNWETISSQGTPDFHTKAFAFSQINVVVRQTAL